MKLPHEMMGSIKTLFKYGIKGVTHVQSLTFLKEKP
jgi:hypothetical protein